MHPHPPTLATFRTGSLALVAAGLLAACGSTRDEGMHPDGAAPDAVLDTGTRAMPDAPAADAADDTSDVANDAITDATLDAPLDAQTDARNDTGTDARNDTGTDAAVTLRPIHACATCVQITVGPATAITGPTVLIGDSPFITLPTASGIRGYSANTDTHRFSGTSTATVAFDPMPNIALGPTRPASGPSGSFDYCGAWLHGVYREGARVIGWYHAETDCDYANNGQTYKSIAYAESTDDGLTFVKTGFPGNQILTSPTGPRTGTTTGNGDFSVVRFGDWFYLYYIDASDPTNWTNSLARSAVSDGGRPGTWTKYYMGSFSQPGLGGHASNIPNLSGPYVYAHGAELVSIGAIIAPGGVHGLWMGASGDGFAWQRVAEPLVHADAYEFAPRTSSSHELIAYPSLSPSNGGNAIGDTFDLFYTYVAPGGTLSERYIVRRTVTIRVGDAPISPQVGIAFTRYFDASAHDHWTTTAAVPASYAIEQTLGYLYTQPVSGGAALYDCYVAGWNDHMVTTDAACGGGSVTNLRTLGWLRTSAAGESSIAIYRCFDSAHTDHFVSTHADCEGAGTMEFPLGYLAARTP